MACPTVKVLHCAFLTVVCWAICHCVYSRIVDIRNIALHKPAAQSSAHDEGYGPQLAVDSNLNGQVETFSCVHTKIDQTGWHWWMVDLEDIYTIASIRITNRIDCCNQELRDFTVEVSVKEPNGLEGFPGRTDAPVCFTRVEPVPPQSVNFECDEPMAGRYIRVLREGRLTLCEFEVFTSRVPFMSTNLAFRMPTKQSSSSDLLFTSGVAVDGNADPMMSSGSCTHTNQAFEWHWWMVDLLDVYTIGHIRITNRADCCSETLTDFTVEVSAEDPSKMKGFPKRTGAAVCFTRVDPVAARMVTFACNEPVEGRYIRVVKNKETDTVLSLCEVEVFETHRPTAMSVISESANLALRKPTRQSSGHETAERAVDGDRERTYKYNSCTHTAKGMAFHWWMVDLLNNYTVGSIRVTNRGDCCSERLQDFTVEVSVEDPSGMGGFPGRTASSICFTRFQTVPPRTITIECDQPVMGRYVRVVKNNPTDAPLTLCELEVYEAPMRPTTLSTPSSAIENLAPSIIAVEAPWNEGQEIITQASETESQKSSDVDAQSPPEKEIQKSSWVQQWKQWKAWMGQSPTKPSLKTGCSICC